MQNASGGRGQAQGMTLTNVFQVVWIIVGVLLIIWLLMSIIGRR